MAAPFSAQIEELSAQPTVCARLTTRKDLLGEVFSRVPGEVFRRLAEAGGAPAGALYARYPTFTDDTVEMEIGIPVAAPVAGLPAVAGLEPEEVGNGELPAGRVASTVHVGSYDGLPATYDRLHSWIHEQGFSEASGPWESYLDDPGDMSDMSSVRTRVVWPIAGDR